MLDVLLFGSALIYFASMTLCFWRATKHLAWFKANLENIIIKLGKNSDSLLV